MATKEFYGYPREGFTPETRELSNGTIVAHAAQTPFWLTQSGLVFALTKDGAWKRRTVSGLKGHPAYGRRQANGCHSGERYPHLGHARKNYAAHKLMALAWLGPIPAGWEVDHINGNILDWTLQNIQCRSGSLRGTEELGVRQKDHAGMVLESLRRRVRSDPQRLKANSQKLTANSKKSLIRAIFLCVVLSKTANILAFIAKNRANC